MWRKPSNNEGLRAMVQQLIKNILKSCWQFVSEWLIINHVSGATHSAIKKCSSKKEISTLLFFWGLYPQTTNKKYFQKRVDKM